MLGHRLRRWPSIKPTMHDHSRKTGFSVSPSQQKEVIIPFKSCCWAWNTSRSRTGCTSQCRPNAGPVHATLTQCGVGYTNLAGEASPEKDTGQVAGRSRRWTLALTPGDLGHRLGRVSLPQVHAGPGFIPANQRQRHGVSDWIRGTYKPQWENSPSLVKKCT